MHALFNRVHPLTGKAATLSRSKEKLSRWALAYEKTHGKIYCQSRANNARNRAEGKRERDRNPAIQALFQALPVFATNLSTVSNDGQIRSELTYNDANTVCPYLSADATPAPTQATGPASLSLQCLLSAPDLLQRGVSSASKAG